MDATPGAPEGYALSIGPGLFYGGQTLLQCLHRFADRPSWPVLEIADRPPYPLRAFMVDPGRSVFSRRYLERIVRIAARLKLNTLHVHLYDDELCGLRFDGLPFGTENPNAITMEDFAAVAAYAREWNVQLIPELKPGPTSARWCGTGPTSRAARGCTTDRPFSWASRASR